MTGQIDVRRLAPRMANGHMLSDAIAAGGQPTAAELEALAAAGYRTVLDIRVPGEPRGYDEPQAVERAGMKYVNVPVGVAPLDDALFGQIRSILRDAVAEGPVLFHCASGNRVGVTVIPYLVLDEGMDPQQAIEHATRAGMRGPQLAGAALDYVERHGADGAATGRKA